MAAAQNSTFDDYEDDEEGDWEEQTDEDGEMEEAQEDDLGREAAGGELEGLKETAELYKSNIFKLEVRFYHHIKEGQELGILNDYCRSTRCLKKLV